MKYEYELHRSIRDKKNGVKWLSNMVLNACWGVELANENFNPFDFKLKGWSEQMSEDIGDYYDVFGELYEKYFKTGKPIPPELKLFFMISGSAIKFHLTNLTINSLPKLGEMMNKNPQLADQLRQQATTDKLRQQNSKTRQAFDNAAKKEHNNANKKTLDIQMLNQKRSEFERMKQQEMLKIRKEQMLQQQMMEQQQQQLLHRQRQLNDLEMRLQAQMSDTRSAYSSRYNQPLQPSQPSQPSQNNFNNQKTMCGPKIPITLRGFAGQNSQYSNKNQQEMIRKMQIEEQQKKMRDLEMDKINSLETKSHEGSPLVNINPNINSIIDSKIKNNKSKMDEDSNLSHDNKSTGSKNSRESKGSKGSKGSRRQRTRKRNNIKIDI
jgi:hypothetical protein